MAAHFRSHSRTYFPWRAWNTWRYGSINTVQRGYYQIHGMTENITLFQDGLIQAKDNEAQPEFNDDIKQKLFCGWESEDIHSRTENAIASVSHFVPEFKTATVGGPPLFGAQQIPGDDATLRVGEVSFPHQFYARSEIIKASSALTV